MFMDISLIVEYFQNVISELDRLVEMKEEEVKKAPAGTVKANSHGKGFQYYARVDGDEKFRYIKKCNVEYARQLAQRRYDDEILKQAKKSLVNIRKIVGLIDKGMFDPDTVFYGIPDGIRSLVNPVVKPADQALEEWKNIKYSGLPFKPDDPEIYTKKGVRVRSKAERDTGNIFEEAGIDYHYEMPVFLEGYGKVFPDFTIYDKKTGQITYWEHFGLVNDGEYAKKVFDKLSSYEKNGIILGKNLVMTFETMRRPLDSRTISMRLKELKESPVSAAYS